MKLSGRIGRYARKSTRPIPLREIQYYDVLDERDQIHLRYDFQYIDPCNGKGWLVGVDCVASQSAMAQPGFDEHVIEPCRAKVRQMLQRKCGVDVALDHMIPQMPYVAGAPWVKARIV